MTATLEAIAVQIRTGRHDEAQQALAAIKPTNENRSEVTFLRGYLQELSFDREGAAKTYQALLEKDPEHSEAAFRAAVMCDLVGDEETATDLYERCAAKPPAHVNAIVNLAVLYEDDGRLQEAEALLQSVLDEYPHHHRAWQFLKSVESSYHMLYDEHIQRERDRRDAVLDVPIADFELSVRSRNCLKQMSIRTLGDLLRITEPELLAYKNFGETSLNEIKVMLTQKGLKLGQGLQQPPQEEQPVVVSTFTRAAVTSEAPIYTRRPVAELELSVRSRKCLQRLGIATLGELMQRSEAELLAIKNFGQTSLTEIKRQLA
ncbi:MAG: DNA-directed RNA polymerase subunit alpha C-terminal domain-containing protein, partial [Planctomycetota bacterium]